MTEYLDTLTATRTAFNTFAEFAAAMMTGYVPTIYPTCRRNRRLIAVLTARGFNSFPMNNRR